MKKVVRTVWIGALSGLAFLAACCSSKGLSRAERKQLMRERDSIQEILSRREGSCVYGTPEIMQRYGLETLRLRNKLDSINYKLGKDVDLEKSAQQLKDKEEKVERMEKIIGLRERLEALQNTIRERESSCVYGSPEILEQYGLETQRLREEAGKLEMEIKLLEEQ
ncbi:MAG: BPS1 family protein [Bacteroidales bacterium]|nr:BPS1 family protein [Bacteroidales bacterium]